MLQARPEFAEWAADSPALLEERFLCQEHNYSDEGCLLSTEPCGIHECGGPLCTSAACVRNMQVGWVWAGARWLASPPGD